MEKKLNSAAFEELNQAEMMSMDGGCLAIVLGCAVIMVTKKYMDGKIRLWRLF